MRVAVAVASTVGDRADEAEDDGEAVLSAPCVAGSDVRPGGGGICQIQDRARFISLFEAKAVKIALSHDHLHEIQQTASLPTRYRYLVGFYPFFTRGIHQSFTMKVRLPMY